MKTGLCASVSLPAHPILPIPGSNHGGKRRRGREKEEGVGEGGGGGGEGDDYNSQGLVAGVPQRRHHAGPVPLSVCMPLHPSGAQSTRKPTDYTAPRLATHTL